VTRALLVSSGHLFSWTNWASWGDPERSAVGHTGGANLCCWRVSKGNPLQYTTVVLTTSQGKIFGAKLEIFSRWKRGTNYFTVNDMIWKFSRSVIPRRKGQPLQRTNLIASSCKNQSSSHVYESSNFKTFDEFDQRTLTCDSVLSHGAHHFADTQQFLMDRSTIRSANSILARHEWWIMNLEDHGTSARSCRLAEQEIEQNVILCSVSDVWNGGTCYTAV